MDLLTEQQLQQLIDFRHTLHQNPETANQEHETAQRVKEFLANYPPDELIENLGGTGIAAVYNGETEGKTLMFRCELDALPIVEDNNIPYASQNKGNGHLCGHDGHMAIISGLGQLLHHNRPKKGRAILLYQPAEETGQGAPQIMADDKFAAIRPDYIFALHNIPGAPIGQVLVRDNVFASASKGMIVRLKGKPSHASHPEGGVNPSLGASQIIQAMLALPQLSTPFEQAALVTAIHTRIGMAAFGTSPGEGEVMFTLRTHRNEDMGQLTSRATQVATDLAKAHQLQPTIKWVEEFDGVENDAECVQLIREAAKGLGFELKERQHPFSWSEDYGIFTSSLKGAMFGLGSGENQPQLHNEDYDFPDKIIPQGVAMFYSLITRLLNN